MKLSKMIIVFFILTSFINKKINLYYENMLKNAKKNIDEKGVLNLSPSISIYEFYDISNEELKPLDIFFNEYLNLRKKYN